MALEPITRQEQIIAGKDLEPITRMEKFLKQYGGGGGGGVGGSSGGGMSYDVIVTSTDGGATLTITHGTYADLKTKIEAHEPAHILLLMDVVNEGATGRYQVPALSIAMDSSGEIAGMVYMFGQPGPVGLYILPDGTAEIRV